MLRVFIILCLFPVALQAGEEFPVKYVAAIPGSCTTLVIRGLANQGGCGNKVMNAAFKNGRVSFSIFPKTGMIIFSGGKDAQPTPDQYKLEIDFIGLPQPDEKTLKLRAKGYCTVKGDVMKAAIIHCEADSEDKRYVFTFKSQGEPEITNFQ